MKKYKVNILYRGEYEYISKKAQYYEKNMSTETADESSNEKRMRLQISPEKQSPRRSPAKSIENIYFNRNSPTSPRNIGIFNTSSAEASVQSRYLPDNFNNMQNQEDNTQNEIRHMKLAMDELKKQIEFQKQTKRFDYQGTCLFNDVDGKTPVKWALACSKVLFTNKEIMENVLVKTSKSSRGAFDKEKVKLLKMAMQHKYQYTSEKHDKAWGAIRDAINTRGRNLRWNLKVQTLFRHGKDKDQESD